MKNKGLKIAAIIIAVGLILAVAMHFFTSIRKMPTVTEQDFEYSITYKLNGETKTLNGIYTCRFDGFGNAGIDPLDRYYVGEYMINGVKQEAHSYTIAQKDTVKLYIVMLFNDSYLMGDTKHESYYPSLSDPYLEAADEEGYAQETYENEFLNMFDAEIVSFEYPEPIENTFVFAGFAGLHPTGVLAMTIVGLLTLILCVILVKKGEGIVYNSFDVIGIVLNFIAIFMVLPFISIAAYMIQAFKTGPDWIYQAYLCIPPIIPFTVAAAVSLRRKGFCKSGFFIQFLGPVFEVILIVLEYIL